MKPGKKPFLQRLHDQEKLIINVSYFCFVFPYSFGSLLLKKRNYYYFISDSNNNNGLFQVKSPSVSLERLLHWYTWLKRVPPDFK